MWWITRPTSKEVDEEDAVESFNTAVTTYHGDNPPTTMDLDKDKKGLDISDSYINIGKKYKKCIIPEKIRYLKKDIFDSLSKGMLTVDDYRNNVNIDKNNYAKFGLNFMLSSDTLSKETTQQQSECNLRAYIFFTYELSGQLYADIRSMTFKVDPSKDRVFVPIDCHVIDRKRAASARIIRLLIEFEDPSSDSNSDIGIEKVAVVAFGAEDNTNEAETYKQTAIVPEGKRILYGVLQVDPVMLVSNKNVTKSKYHLPHAQAILGNVVYDGYRTPYPTNSTKTYRIRFRFNGASDDLSLYFFQIDLQQYQENVGESLDVKNLKANDFTNVPELMAESDSSVVDGLAAEADDSEVLSFETIKEAQEPNAVDPDEDTVEHQTFRKENVTKIHLGNVEPERIYECTFACADPRVTISQQSKTCICLSDDNIDIVHLEIVPMNSHDDTEMKPRLVLNQDRDTNQTKFIQFDTLKLDELIDGTEEDRKVRQCTDYIVDSDASILRLNQDPLHKAGSGLPLCTKELNPPITVNDGWMYTGTLRLPLVHSLADENRLLHMKIATNTKATFDFTISRIGAYLHLNGQPVAVCKMKLTANVVKFSIYIYKNLYGISINNQQPITNGTSRKLYALYYSAGRALTKDEMATSRHLASYPKIKSIRVKVDKESMLRSRFISAIGYEPRPVDFLHLTPEDCETRLTRMPFAWSKSVNPGRDKQVTLTNDVTDSISLQVELKSSDITEAIVNKAKTVSSRLPEDILNAVYPDSESTTDRECHLVKMTAGNSEKALVTLYLYSMSDLYARQYEIRVRFDGCQSGPFDKQAPHYALGNQMLFQIPSTSAGKIGDEERRIIIKCTLHKRRVRVCLFVKHKNEAPILMKSFAHEVSLNFDLPSNINAFPKLTFDTSKVTSIVCADRATSTLCNPYSLEEDKKNEPACKINPMTGTRMSDPNYRITDFPAFTPLEYAKNNKYSDYKCSQTTRSSNQPGLSKCLEEAKKTFPQGHVTYVTGSNTGESECNANCIMGDGSCKLVDMKNGENDYTVYSFYNNFDVVEQIAETIR